MENAANRIALTGALDTLPEYSHTNHDRKFYRLMLGGRAPVRRGRSSARAGSGGRTGRRRTCSAASASPSLGSSVRSTTARRKDGG